MVFTIQNGIFPAIRYILNLYLQEPRVEGVKSIFHYALSLCH